MRTPVTVGFVLEEGADLGLVRAMDQLPKANLAWVCDRRVRRDDIDACAGHAARTDSVDDLLEDDEVDAIVVLSRDPASRAELAGRALEADKHVLVDGTIAPSTEAADRLVNSALSRQRVVSGLHRSLLHSATPALREAIMQGRLGELYYLRALHHAGRGWSEELWSVAADEVARIVHVLADEPVEVVARGDAYAGAAPDVISCLLRFATGITAQVEISALDARPMKRVAAVGSRATALLDEHAPHPLTIFNALREAEGGRDGDVFSPYVDLHDPALEACELFLGGVRSPAAPVPPRDAIVVVAVVEALRSSLADAGSTSRPAPGAQPELRVIGS